MKLKSKNPIPKVRDIMQRKIVRVRADMRVEEMCALITLSGISGAPVVDANGNTVGVVSQADIVAQATTEPSRDFDTEGLDDPGLLVQDIMTPVVHYVHQEDNLRQVVSLMLQATIHRVFVTDGKNIIGIVTTMDLIQVIPDLISYLSRRPRKTTDPPSKS